MSSFLRLACARHPGTISLYIHFHIEHICMHKCTCIFYLLNEFSHLKPLAYISELRQNSKCLLLHIYIYLCILRYFYHLRVKNRIPNFTFEVPSSTCSLIPHIKYTVCFLFSVWRFFFLFISFTFRYVPVTTAYWS